jgi:hypothetical protein
MRILFIGEPGGTSNHRRQALVRIGHAVRYVNPRAAFPAGRLWLSLGVRTGFRIYAPLISRHVVREAAREPYDLVWADCGAELGPSLVRDLTGSGREAVNYNHDDPFGPRDGRKWDLYRQALRHYQMAVVVRSENVEEALALGARKVALIYRPYDPVGHAPVVLDGPERAKWASEVLFAGCWMKGRDTFLARLVDAGIPLRIYGDRWEQAPLFSRIRHCWAGTGLDGRDYAKAISGAKVALGLLSHENRDRHTTRSAEIPYIGGAAFCAERTADHEAMFSDGVEAMLWRNADECVNACRRLLSDEGARVRMVERARQRIIGLGLSNDEILQWIFSVRSGPGRLVERPLNPHASP